MIRGGNFQRLGTTDAVDLIGHPLQGQIAGKDVLLPLAEMIGQAGVRQFSPQGEQRPEEHQEQHHQ
ncbi:MAG: hypothetical protein ACP5RV_09995 [Thiomonas sp.]